MKYPLNKFKVILTIESGTFSESERLHKALKEFFDDYMDKVFDWTIVTSISVKEK